MSTSNTKSYTRFTIFQRVEHIILLLSFSILGLTGLPQKYPLSPISQSIVQFLGGIETIRIIHRAAAVIFMVQAIYHLVVIGYKLIVQGREASMLPGIRDAQNAIQWFGYNLGRIKNPPKMPRYNFMEKAEYWAMLWGLLVMAATGFMLWNPIATTNFLPGEFIPAAKAAHGGEALLAVLAIILWHFYHVHIKHFNKSMFTGQISRNEMVEEHGLELEKIESGAVAPAPTPAQIRARTAVYAPLAAIVSLAMLAGIYVFVTFEESAITTVLPAEQVAAFSPQTSTPRPTATITPTNAPTQTSAPTEPGATQEAPQASGAAAWDSGIAALFEEKCAACHGQVGDYNTDTYENTMKAVEAGDPEASRLVEVQVPGNHPGQFAPEELEQIIAWIEAGAPESGEQAAGQPGGEPDQPAGSQVAWESGVADLFNERCTACHGQVGGYNAESYENAINGIQPGDPEGSDVMQVQEAGDHPGKFTPEELEQIRQWIEAGAPQAAGEPAGDDQASDGDSAVVWIGGFEETFKTKCGACHGSLGGFSAESYEDVLKAVKPGDADDSILVQVQREGDHPGKFSAEELENVILWITAGAPQE